MTQQEFNTKYKDYIPGRFHGCELINEIMIDYLDKEMEELIKLPDFLLYQVKPKWFYYCFYADGCSFEKIHEIENKLKKISDELGNTI